MSHTPAVNARIKKTDTTLTTVMAQPQAFAYLKNVLNDNGRAANLSQAMNDVFNGKGKTTGSYTQDGNPVWHASSGNGQQSVTLFYYLNAGTATLFAMGQHKTSSSYSVSEYGQPTGSFRQNATINL